MRATLRKLTAWTWTPRGTMTAVLAGHGFLRRQDGRDGANLAASQKAWPATVEFLRKRLE